MATKTTITPHPGGTRTGDEDTSVNAPPADPPDATANSGSSATSGVAVRPGPEIDWTDLDGRTLSDADEITRVDAAGTGDHLTLQLVTTSDVTWWKDIEVRDSTGAVAAAGWTQDATHESLPISVPNAAGLAGLQLVFGKAGFLGIHGPAYQIQTLEGMEGHTMTFTWRRDR